MSAFPKYAEPVPKVGGVVDSKESPSIAMLVEAAKTHKIHLVGGSIPEREVGSDGLGGSYRDGGVGSIRFNWTCSRPSDKSIAC